MVEKTVAEGEEIRLPLTIWEKVETRLVNLSNDESLATFSYFKEGTEISEGIISSLKRRTVILKELGKVHYGTRSYHGDEMVFTVKKGKMLIKLGQFDAYKF